MFSIVVCPVYTVLVRVHDLYVYVLLSVVLLDYHFVDNSGDLVLGTRFVSLLCFLSQPLRRMRCLVAEA